METQPQAIQSPDCHSPGRILIVLGLVAFAAAMLLHHRFQVGDVIRDAGIYPAAICTALLVWTDRWWLYVVAAIAVAVPALGFFEPAALAHPAEIARFLNNLFLLLAALFVVAGAIGGSVSKRRR